MKPKEEAAVERLREEATNCGPQPPHPELGCEVYAVDVLTVLSLVDRLTSPPSQSAMQSDGLKLAGQTANEKGKSIASVTVPSPPSASAREEAERIVRHSTAESPDDPDPVTVDGPAIKERIAAALEKRDKTSLENVHYKYWHQIAGEQIARAEAAEAKLARATNMLQIVLGWCETDAKAFPTVGYQERVAHIHAALAEIEGK